MRRLANRIQERGTSMRILTASVCLVLLCSPAQGGDRVSIEKKVLLNVPARYPAKLLPNGRSVLFVNREADGSFAYCTVGADGKGEKKIFTSAIETDDMFAACFGNGVISPDGKMFLAVTTHNGKPLKQGGIPAIVAVDMLGKTISLPSELGWTISGVFGNEGVIYYVDVTPLQSPQAVSLLKKFDVQSQKVEAVCNRRMCVLAGLTLSPDRARLGMAMIVGMKPAPRQAADGPRPKPEDQQPASTSRPKSAAGWGAAMCRLWIYDLSSKQEATSPAVRLDAYFYDGPPWIFWSADGKALCANAGTQAAKEPFSIARFEVAPVFLGEVVTEGSWQEMKAKELQRKAGSAENEALRALGRSGVGVSGPMGRAVESAQKERVKREAKEGPLKLTMHQRGKSLLAMCDFASGLTSAADLQSGKAFVLDTSTDKTTELPEPLLLVDRVRDVGLFLDLKEQKYCVAKIVVGSK